MSKGTRCAGLIAPLAEARSKSRTTIIVHPQLDLNTIAQEMGSLRARKRAAFFLRAFKFSACLMSLIRMEPDHSMR